MGDWTTPAALDPAITEGSLAVGDMTLRLLCALVCGLLTAGTYLLSRRNPPAESFTLSTTLVLLTLLVAMTTMVIGSNLARAFGLVGALSIVRFRTVVEDTRDTAFVIYAVVVGMALGSGNYTVCALGMPLVSAAAIGLHFASASFALPPGESLVLVRVGIGHDLETLLRELFEKHLISHRIRLVESARQGIALDVQFAVRLRPGSSPLAFVKGLQQTDGVQSVEWKDAS